MTSPELLICLFLISVSGYLSASEVALFSLSRFQLRVLKDRFRSAHRKIKQLLADPGGLLISILVCNEVVNISMAAVVTTFIAREWNLSLKPLVSLYQRVIYFAGVPEWAMQTLFGILMTTPVLLIFCEATPKVIGARVNQLVSLLTASPMTWIYSVLRPVRYIINKILSVVVRVLGKKDRRFHVSEKESLIREDEFLSLVEEGHKEGAIHKSELELIQNIFELDDRTVMDVYTPLSQTHTLMSSTTITAAMSAMRGERYSRIPVTDPTRKKILGILYAKDLLSAKLDLTSENQTIETLIKKPLIISPSTQLNALFRILKQNQTHMAVIVVGGPSGDAMGIVTMADVLEAIFEDIFAGAPPAGQKSLGVSR